MIFVVILLGVHPEPGNPMVGRMLAVAVLMAFLWLTDAIPLAVTALLPVALFPTLGIMKGREVAPLYLNNILFLFIGGFIIALAMEKWNLHKRVALKVILAIGGSPSRLLLGFMAASWFLSMWVSNTATTLMMVPIVIALLAKLEERGAQDLRPFQVALLLGVAYAASIGGMATLVGTAPNLSFARIYASSFPEAAEVTFLGWMGMGLPVSVVLFVGTFFLLRFMHTRKIKMETDPQVIREEYERLGPTSFEEKVVFVVFSVFAVLLVTRADVTMGDTVIRGWGSLFRETGFLDDGTVAISVALVLFLIPARSAEGRVMDESAIGKLPWDIIILLGGGFALARGFQDSGLSTYLGSQLAMLQGVHPLIVVFAITAMITFLTELTSNTATTQVLLPIIASLSVVTGIPPMLLMVPATIAASCAFMLPVATPPNAIVFGSHRLAIQDMVRVGIRLNGIAIVVITTILYIIGYFRFQ